MTADDGRKRAGELANVVLFAFITGWRTASEVLPLEWRHVDWAGRCVRLDAHTTKNGEARSFPFTGDIEKVLKEPLVIHETLKKDETICPHVFHRDGARLVHFRAAWRNACKATGCPGALVHDMRDLPFGRSSVPAYRGRSPCRSSGTRRSRSIGATLSWMRRCSGRPRHAWMPGRLPLRQHHRRPPSLLSVEVVDSGAASRGESGHPTTRWAGIDAQCGVNATDGPAPSAPRWRRLSLGGIVALFGFRSYQAVGPGGNNLRDLCLFTGVHVIGIPDHNRVHPTGTAPLALYR